MCNKDCNLFDMFDIVFGSLFLVWTHISLFYIEFNKTIDIEYNVES